MKKIILSVSISLFLLLQAHSQLAYFDTKDIVGQCITISGNSFSFKTDPASVTKLCGMLKAYLPDALRNSPATTEALVLTKYKNNPFIGAQISPLIAGSSATAAGESSNKTPLLRGLGSANVTNIADGIARFLIKRGKEELNAAFFDRLKKFLKDHDECKILFPATTEFLGSILSYQYTELIQSLREAFHKDLSNLIIGLNQLIDLPKYENLLKQLPEIRIAIRSTKIVSELSQSTTNKSVNPADVIDHLSKLREWTDIHPNLGNSWKLLKEISGSLRNNDNTHIWIQLDQLNSLINDQIMTTIFLGLFYQSVEGIEFKVGNDKAVTVQEFLEKAKNNNNIFTALNLVENFALLANDIDRTIADLFDKRETLSSEDYYAYISKAISITEYGFKVANFIKPGITDNKYIIMARNANELYRDIYTKNYNNAIMNAYTILVQVFNHAEDLAKEKIERKKLTGSDSANLIAAAKSNDLPEPKVIEGILKYGNFFASVIKAESAEDVENAIDAAALPAGSYSIKQRSEFNISLNGYIGYGWDIDEGHGIYAPVGLAFSKGLGKENGGALTLFTAIIDVGSIASYRLKNGNDEELKQEIRLESIFAPSAQLLFEIPKFPIAIGPGWRRTPKLFYSSATDFTVVKPKNVFNFSILIDIPIFTIKNIPYKK